MVCSATSSISFLSARSEVSSPTALSFASLTRPALDLVDESTPLNCVSNLIELETIVACEYIFTWIESRVERLTKVRPVLPP